MITVRPGVGTFTGASVGLTAIGFMAFRGGATVITVLPGTGMFTGASVGLTAIGFMAFAGVQP